MIFRGNPADSGLGTLEDGFLLEAGVSVNAGQAWDGQRHVDGGV